MDDHDQAIAAFARDLQDAADVTPAPAVGASLAAVLDGRAPTAVYPEVVSPGRIRPVGRSLRLRWAVATAAFGIGAGSLGVAGALPDPVQRQVARMAEVVGVDLPDGKPTTTTTVTPPPSTVPPSTSVPQRPVVVPADELPAAPPTTVEDDDRDDDRGRADRRDDDERVEDDDELESSGPGNGADDDRGPVPAVPGGDDRSDHGGGDEDEDEDETEDDEDKDGSEDHGGPGRAAEDGSPEDLEP